MDERDRSKIVELERFVLRLMCSGERNDASIADARRELATYNWHDEDNRVVFDALKRVRNAEVIPLREQLAAHVTRMGFPDVDWDNYFPLTRAIADSVDPQELKKVIVSLLAASADCQ